VQAIRRKSGPDKQERGGVITPRGTVKVGRLDGGVKAMKVWGTATTEMLFTTYRETFRKEDSLTWPWTGGMGKGTRMQMKTRGVEKRGEGAKRGMRRDFKSAAISKRVCLHRGRKGGGSRIKDSITIVLKGRIP